MLRPIYIYIYIYTSILILTFNIKEIKFLPTFFLSNSPYSFRCPVVCRFRISFYRAYINRALSSLIKSLILKRIIPPARTIDARAGRPRTCTAAAMQQTAAGVWRCCVPGAQGPGIAPACRQWHYSSLGVRVHQLLWSLDSEGEFESLRCGTR